MIVFVSLLSYVLMILGSFFLNKRFRSENPDCHSYRWGFFMALYLAATGFLFVVGDLGGLYDAENSILIAVLTSGFIPALLTVTAFVAYGLFVQGLYKRNRFAWLFMIAIAALTSFSLTVLLVITSVTTGEGAGATLAVAIISFLVIVSHVFYVRKRWEELHRLRLPLSRAPSAGDPAPAGQAPQTGSTAPAVGQLQFNIPVTWAVGLVAVIILIPLSIFLTVGFDEGVEAEPSEVSQTSTPEPEETIESLAPEPVEVAQIPAPDPMAKVRQAEQFIDVENYARALPLFMEAAEGGIAQAQGRLGWMYNNGYGVPQNSQLSSVWSQRAAEQGDALGQAMLGYKWECAPKTGQISSKIENRPIGAFQVHELLELDRRTIAD